MAGYFFLSAGGARRLVLWMVIYLQSPLAYDSATAPRHPISPLSVLARTTLDHRDARVAAAEPSTTEHNSTASEMIISAVLMPGILIRTPANVWFKVDSKEEHFHELLHDAIDLCTQKMRWWKDVRQRELLVIAGALCSFGGIMLVFGRRGYAQALYSGLLLVGLLVFAFVIYLNEYSPTKQLVVAIIFCIFEIQDAQSKVGVSVEETKLMKREFENKRESSSGSTTPNGATAAGSANSKPSRRSKKHIE